MAQFDTSIFTQTRPRSVADYTAEMDAAEERKLAGESNRMALLLQGRQVRAAQQAESENNRLMAVMRSVPATATDDDLYKTLRGAGFITQADAARKSALDRKKETVNIADKEAETVGRGVDQRAKVAAQYRADLDQVNSPEAAAQWLRAQFNDPVLGPHMRSMGTYEDALPRIPKTQAEFESWRKQAGMGMEKFIADQTARRGQDITAETSRGNNAATVAEMARGHTLSDQRSRETTSAAVTKPFEVTGPDGVPILVQQDKQGNLKRVDGFGPKAGASKPLTEGQAKANLFGTRMQEANDTLDQLAEQGVMRPSLLKQGAEGVPLIGGGLGMLANAAASPGQQQVEQAQRDFINAVLRRESGAAIADSEFKNADKQYFPQPNDAPPVIAQKRRNRETAIQGLMAEVPVASRTKPAKIREGGATGDFSAGGQATAADPKGRPPLSSFGAR